MGCRMFNRFFSYRVSALLLALAFGVNGASAQSKPAPADPAEVALRQSLQETLWPADIMRLSADYLRQYPRGPWSDAARVLYERSRDTMRTLGRTDVHLYKPAFQPGASVPPEVKADIRKAALGDHDAAARLAYWCRQSDKDLAEPLGRYVGWLQFASLLGNDRASYELALYYRQVDQPALAAMFEARAVALGFVLPTVLDNVRK
jgi:hypothetical protein